MNLDRQFWERFWREDAWYGPLSILLLIVFLPAGLFWTLCSHGWPDTSYLLSFFVEQ